MKVKEAGKMSMLGAVGYRSAESIKEANEQLDHFVSLLEVCSSRSVRSPRCPASAMPRRAIPFRSEPGPSLALSLGLCCRVVTSVAWQGEGVVVRRPDVMDFNVPVKTPDFEVPRMNTSACPRDTVLVLGPATRTSTAPRARPLRPRGAR
jgi:hypothetical protein